MHLVVASRKDARLALIASGDKPNEELARKPLVSALSLDEVVRLFPFMPMDRAWPLTESGKVRVSPNSRGPLYDASSPTKAVEHSARGLHLVGSDIPGQAAVVATANFGRGAACEPSSLASALLDGLAWSEDDAARTIAVAYFPESRSHSVLSGRIAPVLGPPSSISQQ